MKYAQPKASVVRISLVSHFVCTAKDTWLGYVHAFVPHTLFDSYIEDLPAKVAIDAREKVSRPGGRKSNCHTEKAIASEANDLP